MYFEICKIVVFATQFIYRANGRTVFYRKQNGHWFCRVTSHRCSFRLFYSVLSGKCTFCTRRNQKRVRCLSQSIRRPVGDGQYSSVICTTVAVRARHRSISVQTIGHRFTHFIDSFRFCNHYIRLLKECRIIRIHCPRIITK